MPTTIIPGLATLGFAPHLRVAEIGARKGKPVPAIIRPSTEFFGKAKNQEIADSRAVARVLDVGRYRPMVGLGFRAIRR
jgi:hypothetical protein